MAKEIPAAPKGTSDGTSQSSLDFKLLVLDAPDAVKARGASTAALGSPMLTRTIHLGIGTGNEALGTQCISSPGSPHSIHASAAQEMIRVKLTTRPSKEDVLARTIWSTAMGGILALSPNEGNVFAFVKAWVALVNRETTAMHVWTRKGDGLPESWRIWLKRKEQILIATGDLSLKVFSDGGLWHMDMSTWPLGQEHLRGFIVVRNMLVIARLFAPDVAIQSLRDAAIELSPSLRLPIMKTTAIGSSNWLLLERTLDELSLRLRATPPWEIVLTNEGFVFGFFDPSLFSLVRSTIKEGTEAGTIPHPTMWARDILRGMQAQVELKTAAFKAFMNLSYGSGGGGFGDGGLKTAYKADSPDATVGAAARNGKRNAGDMSTHARSTTAAAGVSKKASELAQLRKDSGLCTLCAAPWIKGHNAVCTERQRGGAGSGHDGAGGKTTDWRAREREAEAERASKKIKWDEQRRKERGQSSGANTTPVGAAYGDKGGGGGGSDRARLPPAPTTAAAGAAGASGGGERKCYNCQQVGHIKANCPVLLRAPRS